MHDNSEEYFRLKYLKYKAKYLRLTEELEGGYADDKVRSYITEIISGLTDIQQNKNKSGIFHFNAGKKSLIFQKKKAALKKIVVHSGPPPVLPIETKTIFGLDAFPLVRYVDFLLKSKKRIKELIPPQITPPQTTEEPITPAQTTEEPITIEKLISTCYEILGNTQIEGSSKLKEAAAKKDVLTGKETILIHVNTLNTHGQTLLDEIVVLINSYNPPSEKQSTPPTL